MFGEQQRQAFPRDELAKWSPHLRKQRPLKVLQAAMHGRVPALASIKKTRMKASAFGFFRGAVPIMAYDLSLMGSSGVVAQLCGDAHVQNLGAYSNLDGRLTFDINDFDETIRGPFEWDVKRMATSILLAGQYAKMKGGSCTEAAEVFLSEYCSLIQRLAHMPVLEVARYQVHRLARIAPISEILAHAEHSTPLASLNKLTEKTKDGRRFQNCPPLLRRVTGKQAAEVLASLGPYTQSLLPERRHFLAQFRAVDVAFKVVGTGSIGLRDYCVYLEGNPETQGGSDPLFLQIKEEAHSAYWGYLPQVKGTAKHQGQRAADGQRAMQLVSDPLLGWTHLHGRDYLVRQLNDHKASVDITKMKPKDLAQYAAVCGELLARGHARSGSAREIAGYLGVGKRFRSAIMDFARAYAEQTVTDWKEFCKEK
jgi:uncharacterized protein (DUF2252 family)